MIEKEIREYKQGNKTVQRINILKSDNMDNGKVIILSPNEYEDLKNDIEYYKQENEQLDYNLIEFQTKNKELSNQIKNQRHYDRIFKRIENSNIKNLSTVAKELDKKHNNQIIEINKEYNSVLDEKTREYNNNYKLFNKELIKYRVVYELQNKALKEISELGYVDLFRNKFRKIAKENIRQLDKPVEIEVLPPEKTDMDKIKELINKFEK